MPKRIKAVRKSGVRGGEASLYVSERSTASLGLSLALAAFLIVPTGVRAQDSPFTSPQNNPPGAAAPEELPILLLFPPAGYESSGPNAKKRNDPTLLLLDALRRDLRTAGKYRVLTYSPTLPVVRRAVLEHVISPSELAKDPIPTEIAQQIARTLGAQSILNITLTQDKDSLTADLRLQEAVGLQDWRVAFGDKIKINANAGKRRLKPSELIEVAADGIAVRLGAPSQLAANLRLEDKPILLAGPDKKKNEKKPKPTDGSGETQKAAAGTSTDPPGAEATPDRGQPVFNNTEKNEPGNTRAATKTPPPKKERPEKNMPPRVKDKPTDKIRAGVTPGGQEAVKPITPPENTTPPANPNGSGSVFGAEKAPGSTGNQTPSEVIPPTASQVRQDHETEAMRFRQAGDIANVIASLRRAINEKPRDRALRRQLIQAYQERQMTDAALSETSRALQVVPEDAILHRLYGNSLLAKGDVTGAVKSFREAIRLDPTDISAQVAMGDALLADNQYTEAFQAYEAASKNDPKSPLPHRRLARALAGRASSDPKQYAASIAEIQKARELTAPGDAETYVDDYVSLMRLIESRLRDVLTELQNSYQARVQGKQSANELLRIATDMTERAEAASEYLDKLPPAPGHSATHARYQQGTALILQAITLFRDYLSTNNTQSELGFKSAQVDAQREFGAASKRLNAPRTAGGQPGNGE